ncbi:uncharacterized protein G2W53_001502 [Senna tora]|uniref:Uncharacterized protein n=1 Tax=Senna tora TaxID=362788 RepID=A0A834XI18_9FABA|nr:uncharacterized protein G2W53_001502 [Senna tora]
MALVVTVYRDSPIGYEIDRVPFPRLHVVACTQRTLVHTGGVGSPALA